MSIDHQQITVNVRCLLFYLLSDKVCTRRKSTTPNNGAILDPTFLLKATHFLGDPNALPHWLNIPPSGSTGATLDISRLRYPLCQMFPLGWRYFRPPPPPTNKDSIRLTSCHRYRQSHTMTLQYRDIYETGNHFGEVSLCQRRS